MANLCHGRGKPVLYPESAAYGNPVDDRPVPGVFYLPMHKGFIFLLAVCLCAQAAQAQQKQTFVIRNGKLVAGPGAAAPVGGGEHVVIAQDQQLMFNASASLVRGDYQTAERLYSQAIAINGGNIDAYLQRGFVRREMGNLQGTSSDARTAIALANRALQQRPRDAELYYQRSMGLRLIRQFDLAEKDVRAAMQLGGKPTLRNDLQAIELEKKMAAAQVVR